MVVIVCRCAKGKGGVGSGDSGQVQILFHTVPVTSHSEPHFVHALEHGDHVYFFFREVSVEDARLGRVRRWAVGVVAGGFCWLLGAGHLGKSSWLGSEPTAELPSGLCPLILLSLTLTRTDQPHHILP